MDSNALEILRRNSGLSLDAHGNFFSAGQRVPNERVQRLFHEGLAIRETGDVTLTLGKVWAYVAAESVARFVTRLVRREGVLEIALIDGTRTNVEKPRVSAGPDNRLYVWETPEAYPAVLLRSAHNALAEILEDRDGEIGFQVGMEWVRVGRLGAIPGPVG